MKVLQVLNHFLPQQTAGTEVYSWALSKQLQQHAVAIQIVIPNYGKETAADYVYDGLAVHQYAEPSVVDRSLIMGFRAPDGLPHFIAYLKNEQPDIVHFHELAGSNGITLKHVQAAKATGAKVIMTFHLAGYSCKTGTLVYKGEVLCDGVIDLKKCSSCYLHTRGYVKAAPYLVNTSAMLHQLAIDASKWNNKIGTALGTVPIIAKLQNDLHALIAHCDRVVTITNWYKRVLLANGISENKISYIPQGLPLAVNVDAVKEREAGSPLRLLFLGRINKFKGLHLLVEALRTIDPALVELSVYGNSDDAVYEQELRSKTSDRKNIVWKGKLQQQDVVTTMQAHDVLCLCSTFSEMSPLVIQEAFAAGIPVLASEVYGNAEQIKPEVNGLLFRFNDVASLKQQLLRLIEEKGLVAKLKEGIERPKSFEEVGEMYKRLYREVMADV
ncbi:glycosyltransferase [Lacibacter luteus]|uniref:Glycosyltransferase n=1 Tax=Lacibacter luteus TaxID=2508719 RepID=A0A4Q1CD54_9BACT|nr:glycosyltransferase [Lacibacter luteus]RXK57422.1 glycosyltransferase [Lacibacter luteus]